MAVLSLLDIAKMNGSDGLVGLIDEASQHSPEVRLAPARTISGINYKTLTRKTVPSAAFRDAADGTDPVKGTYENKTVETFILNPRWELDKAIADRHEDGAEALIALEAGAIMEGAFQQLAAQFYYGTDTTYKGHAKGFPGLIDSYDSTNMVVDAAGTTATTGSSLWAVQFGPRAVQWVYGNGGALDMGDPRIETITGANSKSLTGYVQELLAYPGLQVSSQDVLGRIKKLTEDSGKGLTDDLIADLLSKFKVGMVPDMLLCTRRSLKQLQQSRTATNNNGAPAPFPTEAFGVPLVVTESLSNVEDLAL